MTNYIIAQSVLGGISVIFTLVLVWRYQVCLSRPTRIREYQYRLFAIRDKAIWLVASGEVREQDQQWQAAYVLINECAKAGYLTVTALLGKGTRFLGIRSLVPLGFRFVIRLLRVSPEREVQTTAQELTPPLNDLLREFVHTYVAILFQGSLLLRLCAWLAHRVVIFRRLLERRRPTEVRNYRQWQSLVDHFTPAPG